MGDVFVTENAVFSPLEFTRSITWLQVYITGRERIEKEVAQ